MIARLTLSLTLSLTFTLTLTLSFLSEVDSEGKASWIPDMSRI